MKRAGLSIQHVSNESRSLALSEVGHKPGRRDSVSDAGGLGVLLHEQIKKRKKQCFQSQAE